MAKFKHLPPELINNMVAFLSTHADLYALVRVNHVCYHAGIPFLWETHIIRFREGRIVFDLERIGQERHTRYLSDVKILKFRGPIQYLPSYAMDKNYVLNVSEVQIMFHLLTNLEGVDFSDLHEDLRDFKRFNAPHTFSAVTKVILRKNSINYFDFVDAMIRLPNMRHVEIDYPTSKKESVNRMEGLSKTEVETLYIHFSDSHYLHTDLPDKWSMLVGSLPKIRTLKFLHLDSFFRATSRFQPEDLPGAMISYANALKSSTNLTELVIASDREYDTKSYEVITSTATVTRQRTNTDIKHEWKGRKVIDLLVKTLLERFK